MRMRDIQILLAVADSASFTKAADLLRLSQPAISLAVKRFEQGLGIRIFERHGHTVRVSKDGEHVLHAVRKINDIFQNSLSGRTAHRRLKIGLSSLLGASDIVSIIRALQQSSGYELEITFAPSETLWARDDLDLTMYIPAVEAPTDELINVELGWIGARNGTFIQSTEERGVWDLAFTELRKAKIQIERIIDVNSSLHAYELAAGGIGFTPCVLNKASRFANRIVAEMPALPALNVAIRAEDHHIVEMVAALISVDRIDDVTASASSLLSSAMSSPDLVSVSESFRPRPFN
ncbi:LysR family transcriptional regulator [Flaviflagellibacter deserti]|uniref:LysR family transcriptional regulator n=1 Tax=Flaviflagellibacter deserti TaxID=2267266 RepID=A0ABV9Z161_9HYPH